MNKKNPFFLKSYFIVAMLIIALASFLYIQDIIFKLEETSVMQTRIFARFTSNLANEGNIDEIIFEEIIKKIRFPIIVTDTMNNPISWRNIGKYDELFHQDLTDKDLIEIKKIMNKLDRENQPIEIKYQNKTLVVVHYGMDALYKRLQFAPFFQLLVTTVFLILGIYAYMLYRKSQENFIWAGMAKETAHQIGTPLSSLYGWIEIMKNKKLDNKIVSGIEEDAERLNIIATRFNKIGSPLTIELVNISKEIENIINYFKRRVPQRGKKKIEFKFKSSDISIPVDKELFKWSIENMIRNSIDALKGIENGIIEIIIEQEKHNIKIKICDNGKGIEKKNVDQIFSAGFSTKTHGWGIGLPLTKKIVEEFHKGKLYLDYTLKDKGTCFVILLPEKRKRYER